MKTSLVTATLFAATLFTSTASAQESVLESLLTNLVGQALSASTVEIQNGVSQSIANVTYHFDLDDEASTGGDVEIMDIDSVSPQESSAQESSEKEIN